MGASATIDDLLKRNAQLEGMIETQVKQVGILQEQSTKLVLEKRELESQNKELRERNMRLATTLCQVKAQWKQFSRRDGELLTKVNETLASEMVKTNANSSKTTEV